MGLEVRVIRTRIDYNLSLSTMVVEGRFDCIGYEMLARYSHFPNRGIGDVELNLLFFDRPPLMTDGSLTRLLSEMHLRSGETPELLKIGALEPEWQRQFPIVAFGSWANAHLGKKVNDGHTQYPCLDTFEEQRRFTDLWDDPYSNWSGKGGAILAVAL